MCQLSEAIKLYNGQFFHLDYHQKRINNSFNNLFSKCEPININKIISSCEYPKTGIYKFRIVYNEKGFELSITPYVFRKVTSAKLVFSNDIDYSFKYANREKLNTLFEKRENCDDIIIVKHNMITDGFASNLVFIKGDKRITPLNNLLPGTTRARLLDNGFIEVKALSINDIKDFDTVKFINAMTEWEDAPEITVNKII